ncbi:MAG: peptidase M16 [Nitratiruptor sp.]|nr:peptidase M16 [Nitratiruptor sp.]NPA83698.1 insulinase family protein [Campylobacterota bacterium]
MSATLHFLDANGTKVPMIFEEDRSLPLVTLQLIFQKSGSIEDGNRSGLARLSAKMLAQGSRKLGNIGFAKALEERAIRFGTHAGVETLVVEMSALKEHFPRGIELLVELLRDPNLTKESLEQVKTTTIGALMRKRSDYDYIASVNLKRLLFEGTPLQNPSDGTPETIGQITLEDIRSFLATHLVQARAILLIGGDLDLNEARSFAKSLLAPLPPGSLEPLPFYNASDIPKEHLEKEPTQQAYIYFGAPYYVKIDDPDLYKSKVAMFILGSGGFGSRLMEEIRVKRGLAYSAYSFARVNKSHSYFTGYLQTKVENQEEARKLVQQIVEEFVQKGASQEELDAAKQFILGSEPLRNETLSQRLSRAFNEFYSGRPIGYSQKELEQIQSLTLQELNRFIKSHPEMTRLSYSIVTR